MKSLIDIVDQIRPQCFAPLPLRSRVRHCPLDLWFTLMNRMWQKLSFGSFRVQDSRALAASVFNLLECSCCHVEKPGLHCWIIAREREKDRSRQQPAPTAGLWGCHRTAITAELPADTALSVSPARPAESLFLFEPIGFRLVSHLAVGHSTPWLSAFTCICWFLS